MDFKHEIMRLIKMRKKWTFFLLVMITSFISGSIGASAASGLAEIKAYLNTALNLNLAGDLWMPRDSSGNRIYPITYNGTTYLPVRAVGEALGVNIRFESSTNTVYIGSTSATGPIGSSSSQSEVGRSRTNPAPVGTKVTFQGTSMLGYDGAMYISEVIRGDKAWEMVREANMFNDPPAPDHEYMVVRINIEITKTVKAGAAVSLSPIDLTLISTAGKEYDYVTAVEPEPSYRSRLYEGTSHSGWVVFQVKKDDLSPVIAFNRNYDGTGGIWFKTN